MKLASTLLVLGLCSCGAGRVREPADVGLAQTAERFGELERAERSLAALFADEVPRARRCEVFWAGWFLACAHARLAFEPPRDVGLGGGALRAAHAQAALYYARRARLELGVAPELPPEGLEFAGDCNDAALGLDLLELALQGQLGFGERVARMLEADGELAREGGEARLAQAARLDPRTAVRLDLALFDHWSGRDAQRAFHFAVHALAASDAQVGLLGEREVARLEGWIRAGAGRPFRCPECRQPAAPELRACPNDQTPLENFLLGAPVPAEGQGTPSDPQASTSPRSSPTAVGWTAPRNPAK